MAVGQVDCARTFTFTRDLPEQLAKSTITQDTRRHGKIDEALKIEKCSSEKSFSSSNVSMSQESIAAF